jgi:hypothetical protein
MKTLASATKPQTTTTQTPSNDYYDGKFDAAVGLPCKSFTGEYFKGYNEVVTTTGNTPF